MPEVKQYENQEQSYDSKTMHYKTYNIGKKFIVINNRVRFSLFRNTAFVSCYCFCDAIFPFQLLH